MIKRIFKIILFTVVYSVVLIATIVAAYFLAYRDRVFPGVYMNNENVGNWSKEEVRNYIKNNNEKYEKTNFIFAWNGRRWETRGEALNWMIDEKQTVEKVYAVGRGSDFKNNVVVLWNSFWNGTFLEADYNFSDDNLLTYLKKIATEIDVPPVEGLFEFQNGKITAFKPSANGRRLNTSLTIKLVKRELTVIPKDVLLSLPVEAVKPIVEMEKADRLGIKEMIGKGESYFKDSIPTRIYNIKLGAEKFHGILIPPNEIFSFNKNIGTVSAYTGYKQAYVIEKGKTVLGDGGGVCQVSTTLYRAALNAGLPIIERVAHAYRVGYYEPPVGFDATVYDPSPDFKFKNDTGQYILIQVIYDEVNKKLTFEFYGTTDGRVTVISDPVIKSQTPPPTPVYQDDPTLPKGTEKQIDTAHFGASVYFTRKVTRNNEVLIDETVKSNYIPWAAVILRGTKE